MSDSSVLDKKILEMEFRNEQFEAGVSQTLETLAKLSSATSDTVQSINSNVFEGLGKLTSKFDTSGMAQSVGMISDNFTAMGKIGNFALQRVTQKAVDLGVSLGKKVLSPIRSIANIITGRGWSRAMNTKQAEFMIKNLGLSWAEAHDDIQGAVNDTRFGFDEAARAAAQLATSGIQFGPQMQASLKAISNAASMANVEFSDMSHIFTTIASNGTVMTEQLRQFSSRGLNASRALADYLGKSESQVSEMLRKHQISYTQFVEAINAAFGDAGKKANETFTGVLANNKAAFARMGEVYATGFMDAATKVLQATLPKLKEFEKAIKPVGEFASKTMELAAKHLVPIINSLNFTPVKEFVDKYIKPATEYLKEALGYTEEIEGAASGAAMSAEELLEMANKVIRGDYGNGKTRRDQLEALGYSYERIQNKVNELLGCSFRYEVQEEEVAEAQKDSAEQAEKQNSAFKTMASVLPNIVNNLGKFFGAFKSSWKLIVQTGKAILEYFVVPILHALPAALELISGFLGGLGSIVSAVLDHIREAEWIPKFLETVSKWIGMLLGAVKGAVTPVIKFVKAILGLEELKKLGEGIFSTFDILVQFFHDVPFAISNFFTEVTSRLSQLSGVQALMERFGQAGKTISEGVLGAFKKIFEFLGKFFDIRSEVETTSGFLSKVFSWLDKLLGMGTKEGSFIEHLFSEDGLINKGAWAIENFLKIGDKILGFFGDLIKKIFQPKIDADHTTLGVLANGINLLKKAKIPSKIQNFLKFEWAEKLKTLGGPVISFFTNLKNRIGEILSSKTFGFGEKLIDFFKNARERLKEISESDGVQKFLGSIKSFYDFLKQGVIDTFNRFLETLKGLGKIPDKLRDLGVFDALSAAFEKIYGVGSGVIGFFSDLFDKVSGLGKLDGVQKFLASIKDFFGFLKAGALDILGRVLEYLDKFLGSDMFTNDGFINFFGDGGVIDTAASLLSKFTDQLAKAPEAFKRFGRFFTGTGEGTLIGGITGKFPAIQQMFDKAQSFATGLGQQISNVIPDFDLSKITGASKTSALSMFTGLLSNGFKIPNLSAVLGNAAEAASNALDGIAASAAPVGESLDTAAQSGDGFLQMAKEVASVIGEHLVPTLKDWADRAKDLSWNDWMGNLGNLAVVRILFKVGDAAKNVAEGIGNWSGAMKELKGAAENFKDIVGNFKDVPKNLAEMFKAFSGIPKSIDGFLSKWGDLNAVFKQMRKKPFTTALRDFAIAIALIAGSIWLLGSDFINYDKIRDNAGVLLAFAAAAGVLWTSSLLISPEKLTAIGLAFLGMGAGLMFLVAAVALFGHINKDTLIKGGKAVAAFMLIMAVAARIASSTGRMAVFGFLSMALAINLLVPAVFLFGKMPKDVLEQGGAAIVKFMMYMAAASAISGAVGKSAVFSFLAIALAIDLLVPAVYLLGSMEQDKLAQGGLAVVTFMTLMALAIRIASKNSVLATVSFLGITLAVGMLIPIILAVSYIDPARVIGGGAAVVILMLALANAVKIAGDTKASAIGGVIAMSMLMVVIGGVLVELSRFKIGRLLGVAASLSAVLLALSLSFNILGKIETKKALASALAMSAVLAALGLTIGLLAHFSSASSVLTIALSLSVLVGTLAIALRLTAGLDPAVAFKAAVAIDAFGIVVGALIAIAGTLGSVDGAVEACNKFGLMVNALISGFQGKDITKVKEDADDMEKASSSLSGFAEKLTPFLDMLTGVDESQSIAAKNLADTIWQLTKTELVQAISKFVGLEGDMTGFGDAMVAYATAFFNFMDVINSNDSIADNEKLAEVEAATERWMDLVKKLEPNVGLIPLIAGITDLDLFGKNMVSFIGSFIDFNKKVVSIRSIASNKIESVASATERMMDVAKHLDNNKGFIPWIAGYADIGKFGEQLGGFITGFSVFNKETQAIATVVDAEKVTSIKDAVTPMIALTKELKREGGVLEWLLGKTELDKFGENLGTFATGVVTFSNTLTEASVSSVYLTNIGNALKAMAEIGNTDTSNLNVFATSLNAMTTALERLCGDGLVNPENIDTLVTTIYRLRAAAISLASVDINQLNTFADTMKNLASLSIEGFIAGFSTNADTAKEHVEYFLAKAAEGLDDKNQTYNVGGENRATDVIKGFESKQKDAVTAVTRMMLLMLAVMGVYQKQFLAKGRAAGAAYALGVKQLQGQAKIEAGEVAKAAADGFDSHKDDFYDAGANASQGFINGLESLRGDIESKARSIANAAKEAAEAALGEHSPSREFMRIGKYVDMGFAIGMDRNSDKVIDAAESVANGSIAATMVAISALSQMISEDLDAEPTIRPVIDTSGISYGIGQANDLMTQFSASPAINAALDISKIQNGDALQMQLQKQANYTSELENLINNTRQLIDVARQNRTAVIDGDYLFGYVDTRMGMA